MNKKGFGLIELLVVIAIFVVVIGIPYKLFIQELKTTVREVSLSKTSIENVPALEIIRKDIETAGLGLPWDVSGITYQEASSSSLPLYSFNQDEFNDSPTNPPRAIIGKKDNKTGFSYLVLKSTAFGLNKASSHWSYIDDNGSLNIWPAGNTANYNNFEKGDRVIVVDAGSRTLRGGSMYFTITKDANSADNGTTYYGLPSLPLSVYLVYGVSNKNLGAPFNRIDYSLYSGGDTKSECANGTYTLGRSIMQQNDNGSMTFTTYPLLHCVADFQVEFGLDTTGNGNIDTWKQDITNLNAKNIRDELKQVGVYILIQNGTKDNNYNYPYDNVSVGKRYFNLTQITDYKHYRWKILKLVAAPKNLE